MALSGDVIPIQSRRPAPGGAPRVEAKARRSAFPVVLAIAFVTVIGVGALLQEQRTHHAIVRVPQPVRNAIFERARVDLLDTCRLPEAADGLLRDHCVQQATFVLQFPECDATCERTARAQLPHATR